MSKSPLITAFAASLLLTGCAVAQDTPPPETQTEFSVDPNSVAGDSRGVTGTLQQIDVPMTEIAPRAIEVWLPPGYSDNPERHYPVLYMHDGQNLFDPSQSAYSGWDWGVDEAMTALGLDAIVVGVYSVAETRGPDYFPQKAGQANPEAFLNDIGELNENEMKADAYLRFLVETLKPQIDATYRTQPEREHTAIMGSSMGGLISLYAISEYPDVFGAAGMVSTHFPLGDGALIPWFADNLPDPATHRLYFDYGTNTLDWNYEGYQDRMDEALEAAGFERGINWTTRKFDGHDHSERSWRSRVDVPLRFLLAGDDVDGGERR